MNLRNLYLAALLLIASVIPASAGPVIPPCTANCTFTAGTTFQNATGVGITLNTNATASAWGNNTLNSVTGIGVNQAAITYTDSSTGASTTITNTAANWFGVPTFAATNASVVYTNAYGTYFRDPAAGTNATLTNKWAIGGDSFKIGGSTMSSNGTLVTAGSITSGSHLVASGAGQILWAGRGNMTSPADGQITLANNAQTGFTSLQFGGTTSSFPELKRSTTQLIARLADDSADASFKARDYTAGGSTPTLSGTCTTGGQVGGNTAGSFTATCTAQTVIITFALTAPNGWVCNAQDQTTSSDLMKQTANGTGSCTITGTTVASDVIVFSAIAY